MAGKIKKRTASIEKTPLLPESLQSEDEGNSNGRKAVKNLHDRGWHRIFRNAGKSFFHVAVRQQFSCLLFLCLVAVGANGSAQTGARVPTVDTIIAHMAQARADNRASFRSYMVTRDYKLFGKNRDNSKSQVIAR
jgi:hypothetical protein